MQGLREKASMTCLLLLGIALIAGCFVSFWYGDKIARMDPRDLDVDFVGGAYVGRIVVPAETISGDPKIYWRNNNLVVEYTTSEKDHIFLVFEDGLALGSNGLRDVPVAIRQVKYLRFMGGEEEVFYEVPPAPELKRAAVPSARAALYFY